MTTTKRALCAAALASLAVLAGCSGGTDNSNSPAKIQSLVTTQLIGQPGAKLADSLRVKVLTSDDQPVANVTVQWVPRTGGGTAGAGTTSTNADGVTANTWTLGPTPGDQNLEVTVPGTSVPALTISANAQNSGGGGGGNLP